jgi:hypothetical protein
VFNDFGKESQYSNQQDFTMRKAKYTMCLEKLQALRPGAKRANKIVRRRRSGC